MINNIKSPISVAFRVDASMAIGAGHVMRTLTLASALREQGATCRFFCRNHPGNLFNYIKEQGFEAHLLSNANDSLCVEAVETQLKYSDWLDGGWKNDALQTIDAIGEYAIDWLVVDHYGLDAQWERELRSRCKRLMVIDDLADRLHDCDLLLDQNFGRSADDYNKLIPPCSKKIIGPKFALLRKEFKEWREYSLKRRLGSQFKNLLIAMGGIDRENITGYILDILDSCELPGELQVTIILGVHAPWLDIIEKKKSNINLSVRVLTSVNNVAQLMAETDLAIGAIGGMALERCSLGLPTLGIILAENQREAASALSAAGACNVMGTPQFLDQKLPLELKKLRNQKELRKLQKKASAICDGDGVRRVTDVMLRGQYA